eukprot:gene11629-13579_t
MSSILADIYGGNRQDDSIASCEALNLESFMALFDQLMTSSDNFAPPVKMNAKGEIEEPDTDTFSSLKSTIPLSHSNSLLHMKQLVWKNLKAFHLLHEYFQALKADSLSSFSEACITMAIDTLVATVNSSANTDQERIIASTALLSLIVARNDPNLSLRIVKFILSSKYLANLPTNLKSTYGNFLPLEKFDFKSDVVIGCREDGSNLAIQRVYSMATDGLFVYVHCNVGLVKIALTQSQQYTVVLVKRDFHISPEMDEEGGSSSSTPATSSTPRRSWMFIINQALYFRSLDMDQGIMAVLSLDSFEESYANVGENDLATRLGAHPYTLFQDGVHPNRIGVLEYIEATADNPLTNTRLRYLKIGPSPTDIIPDTTVAIDVLAPRSKIQQINTNIFNDDQDAIVLPALESFKISRIFPSVRNGLFFLTKEGNLYFSGKNEILFGDSEPKLMCFEEQSKRIAKVIYNEPELLAIDSEGELFQMAPPTKKNPSNFKDLLTKQTNTDSPFKTPLIDAARTNDAFIMLNDKGEIGVIHDYNLEAVDSLAMGEQKAKIMSATDTHIYFTNAEQEFFGMPIDGSADPTKPAGLEVVSKVRVFAALHTSVVVVTDTDLYVRGSNVFGQLGLGSFKDADEFTRVTQLPATLNPCTITKVSLGLTFVIITTSHNQVFYAGNIRSHIPTDVFVEMLDISHGDTNNSLLLDVATTEYGASILRETVQDLVPSRLFYSVEVYSDATGFIGVILPGANATTYKLFTSPSSPTLQTQSLVTLPTRPFHLSPHVSFCFDVTNQSFVVLENRERLNLPFDMQTSFVGDNERVNGLVLANALLSSVNRSLAPATAPLVIPSPKSPFVSSLPKHTYTISRLPTKNPTLTSKSFLRVDHPVLLWSLILPKSKEMQVMVSIESADGVQSLCTTLNLSATILTLDAPFELRPNVLYNIHLISTMSIKSNLLGVAYDVATVAGVKIDMRSPAMFKDVGQFLIGLCFTVLPSPLTTLAACPSIPPRSACEARSSFDLFESVKILWNQFIGAVEQRSALLNGARDRVTDILTLLEPPLLQAISLLTQHVSPLIDSSDHCSDFIGFLHHIYGHERLHHIYGHERLYSHLAVPGVTTVLASISQLFIASFPKIYNTPILRVSAIHLLHAASSVEPTFPGAPYLLTTAIRAIIAMPADDITPLLEIQCDEDAFTTEHTDPALISFYDMLQGVLYAARSSSSKKSINTTPLFRDALLSVSSDPNANNSQSKLADYKLAAIGLLQKVWSASFLAAKSNVRVSTPKSYSVSRFNGTSSSWSYEDLLDAITIAVDRPLYITGVGLYGDKGYYNVKVAYMPGLNAYSFREMNPPSTVCTSWQNNTPRYIHRIDFATPVRLGPTEHLTIFTKINGPSSSSGYKGKDRITADNGVVFSFQTSNLSSDNGTSVSSGQIPVIYYQMEAPQQKFDFGPSALQESLRVSSKILEHATTVVASPATASRSFDSLKTDAFLQTLLPSIIDSFFGVETRVDECTSVLLPLLEATSRINKEHSRHNATALATSHSHTIKMESVHPYEECAKSTNVVTFPDRVKWMTIQFDPRSLTSQESDRLFLWTNAEYVTPISKNGYSEKNFPATTILVPGNKIIFDFQTASNGNNFNDNNRFGYSATVTGYESFDDDEHDYPLEKLERQLSFYIAQLASDALLGGGSVSPGKTAPKKKGKPAKKERGRKNGRRPRYDSSSESEEDNEEEKKGEEEEDVIVTVKEDEPLDFGLFKIETPKSPEGEKKEEDQAEREKEPSFMQKKTIAFFRLVWSKISFHLEANPKRVYGYGDEVIQDFLAAKEGTLGEELDQFFKSIGTENTGLSRRNADAGEDGDDKKEDKKDEKKKEKDGKKDKKKKDGDKKKKDAKDEDADPIDKAEAEKKAIDDKFKVFPINTDDIESVGRKLRVKRLALLMAHKKRVTAQWKAIKDVFKEERDYSDDSDSDMSDSSSSSSSSSSASSDSIGSWEDYDSDGEAVAVAVAVKSSPVASDAEDLAILDIAAVCEDAVKSGVVEDAIQDAVKTDDTSDKEIPEDSSDNEEEKPAKDTEISEDLLVADDDDKKTTKEDKGKELLSTFIGYTGWDTTSKRLYLEMLRLNNSIQEFVSVVLHIKNQKKTFEESKDSEAFAPFIELWRLVQKKLNKWSLVQTLDEEEFDGISNLFGDGDDDPIDDTPKKKKLPFESLNFLVEFFSKLAPISDSSSTSGTNSPTITSTKQLSRSIRYSFEEFMHSSNINTSTFNLANIAKNAANKGADANKSDSGPVARTLVTTALLSLLEDEVKIIDFFTVIEEVAKKNLAKIDAIKMWSLLIDRVVVPSALENVVWMLATTLHSKQAPKESLPAEWTGRVAQNLAVTSNIHERLRKEFVVHFHTLLETLSRRIKFGTFSDNLVLNALSCFSMCLLPEDIAFVQSSEIFPLISDILGEVHNNERSTPHVTPQITPQKPPSNKGKERLVELDDPSTFAISSPSSSSATTLSAVASALAHLSDPGASIQNASFTNVANKCKVLLSKSPEMMPSLFDESTLTFWEGPSNSTITITLDKPGPVQEIALYIDNSDRDYIVTAVKAQVGANNMRFDINKTYNIDQSLCGWFVVPVNGRIVGTIILTIVSFDSGRVRQLKVLVPEKSIVMPPAPTMKFDATLSLLKLLTFQIFGISINNNNKDDAAAAAGGSNKDLKNQFANLLSSTGVSTMQKQIFSLISSEVQKEISHLDEFGWHLVVAEPLADENSGLIVAPPKDAYLYELLTTLSSLLESNEGKSFIPSKSSIFALLPLMHKGGARIQHLTINICRRMLINLKPTLFDEFVESCSSVISSGPFVQFLLLCVAKSISVQVKSGSSPLADNFTLDKLLLDAIPGTVVLESGQEIVALIRDLMTRSSAWREAIETSIHTLVRSTKRVVSMPVAAYLATPAFWAALASLLVLFDNNDLITGINASNAASEVAIKTCDNHDDGTTEASAACSTCAQNLCTECDRVVHLPKKTRMHIRSPLVNDMIAIEVHESCVRLKLSNTLIVLDKEKHKAIIQAINQPSSESCRFCKQKLDLQNLIPSHGVANVCSSAECKEKAANSCIKCHPCGHQCDGVRDEEVCLPCLHGCRKEIVPQTKKLSQDCDDFCLICWTETLSEAPSIQLECGHIFHHECTRQLLERRWNGSRITLGFSKCPICKVAIDHPSLNAITAVINHIGSEIVRKGKLRIDFLGIQKDPMLLQGGKYDNNVEGYIMDQFAYYLCFKCKQPYFGGSNQCAVAMASPEKFNPEELICGGCSSDDALPICPKHGKDYLEFKCRYCCTVAIWFCFGTTHFCEVCHNKHTELTDRAKHPQCPVAPGGIELPGDECPLHVDHPKTGVEHALGCGICRNQREF